jgi:dienelactone hydrolase
MNGKLKMVGWWLAAVAGMVAGYLLLDRYLFDGVRPKPVKGQGFRANFFAADTIRNRPAIVLVGGGPWGDYWGQYLARRGYAGLSLPYVGEEGLPALPEEIPLEYFRRAIVWLGRRPEVDPDRIIVMGASRNAELALVIAATLNDHVKGVIAYAPSAVVWSNTVLPYSSDEIKPAWTFKKKAIPFLSMPKIEAPASATVQTLSYWQNGLADAAQVAKAAIKVERIKGPVLLLSGEDDQVWPAARMSDLIEKRLREHHFGFPFRNIHYAQAGHLISGDPDAKSTLREGRMVINGSTYQYPYGGTAAGDKRAQRDARDQVLAFIANL